MGDYGRELSYKRAARLSFRPRSHVTGYDSYQVNSMRIGLAFTLFLPYPENLPAFESGEQVYLVNNSPSPDKCEQPVQVG